MANTDKLLLICIFFMIAGSLVTIFDVHRKSYEKGVRDGWHRGRAIKEGTPDIIAIPSDFKEVKE